MFSVYLWKQTSVVWGVELYSSVAVSVARLALNNPRLIDMSMMILLLLVVSSAGAECVINTIH